MELFVIKEFINLLEKFWIIKNDEPELYYSIKDNFKTLSDFCKDKLGCRLILKSDFVKLEKIPAQAQLWMGLPGFEEPMDYVLLCFVLIFLEKKNKNDLFILSQLTESIMMNSKGIYSVDWTLYRHRKSLVRVLRAAAELGMIQVRDGDAGGFADDERNDVLYRNSGLSRYFARVFRTAIDENMSAESIENEVGLDVNRDRGEYRRHRVYKKLMFTPAVYSDSGADFDYIKNFRGFINSDIEKMMGGRLDLHRTAAAVVLPQSSSWKRVFPSRRTISDIVLQLNNELRSTAEIPNDERISMPYSEFYRRILALRDKYISGWSKEYREMEPGSIAEEVIRHMREFSMLEYDGDTVTILPLAGKTAGDYPKDYDKRTGRSK